MQRVRIPSAIANSPDPINVAKDSTTSFENYPVALKCKFNIENAVASETDTHLLLLDYSPVTVNSAVSESTSATNDKAVVTSVQNSSTVGTSYSSSSNYSVILPGMTSIV